MSAPIHATYKIYLALVPSREQIDRTSRISKDIRERSQHVLFGNLNWSEVGSGPLEVSPTHSRFVARHEYWLFREVRLGCRWVSPGSKLILLDGV